MIAHNHHAIKIYTDGGARGNPGPAAAAAILLNEAGEEIAREAKYMGTATNNQAEYTAVLLGLEKAEALSVKKVTVFMDSELVVKQLSGEYKVKNAELAKLFVRVWNLTRKFDRVDFHHVRREYNQTADALVNQTIDEHVRV